MCELAVVEDEELTAARHERLLDELEEARALTSRAQQLGTVALESSALDEELYPGGHLLCDPRCHPFWPEDATPPADARQFSLW